MSRKRLLAYAVSVVAVATALPLSLMRWPGGAGATTPLLAAIMVSAWYGGLGPGLLATALSTLALDLAWPERDWPAAGGDDALRLGVFLVAAVLISSLTARQRRLETALRGQDLQKDQLLATLAHELRNPIAAILNAVELSRCRRPGDTELPVTDIVRRQARNMLRLIDDLTDVSRIGRGKVHLSCAPLDLCALVTDAVAGVRPTIAARRHQLALMLPSQPVTVHGDATRLEQVIVNLLNNAARYTEAGGHITLLVEPGDGRALLRVRDDGVGIAPAVLPHVFDLFVQGEDGSRGGLGIGLNLVRSIVHLHGGEVTARSAGPGRGSEFVVSLPTTAEPGLTGCVAPTAGGGPALFSRASGTAPGHYAGR
jgi:signal transduction histidine kinase